MAKKSYNCPPIGIESEGWNIESQIQIKLKHSRRPIIIDLTAVNSPIRLLYYYLKSRTCDKRLFNDD